MAPPPLTLHLFGPLRVMVRGEPLPRVRTRSVEWLLALLALRHGREVDRSWLSGTLWPESEGSQALTNLRNDLMRLRKALGPEAARLQSPARDLLTLDFAGAEVDVIGFDRGVHTQDEAALRTAVALYTGPLLEGCAEEWVLVERETRAEQCLRALEALAKRVEGRGEHGEALAYLRQAAALDPLRDSLQRELIRLLADSGDLPAALLAYREHRLRLHREMNLEPDGETQALFRQLREEARGRASSSFPVPDSRLESLHRPVPAWERGTCGPQRPRSEPSRLPQPLTGLIGRDQELRELANRISTSRLVTLVGGGGVGKTRLALQVATGLAEASPGSVLFVELSPLTDPALLPAFLAGAVGLQEEARPAHASGMPALTGWLAREPTLLVLDNCEHLISAVAELAQSLLQACPELRLLATSRRRLGLTGEIVWRVPSLPAPDPAQLPEEEASAVEQLLQFPAAQLFLERAASARPGFHLHRREEAVAVARICQRLDGVPLALELAAARASVLPVAQIATRLDNRFQLLTGGSPAALPRHRTLRALIDWSYDSLPPAEAALLHRLSVFAGGWTLAAAEAVSGGPVDVRRSAVGCQRTTDVLDLLDSLEACSLVLVEESEGGLRYRMLETVREYAREKLRECGEEAMAQAAHLAYCLELAEGAEAAMHGPAQGEWLDRLETEHANLRTALTRCLEPGGDAEVGLRLAGALHNLWVTRSHYAEGRQYPEILLASPRTCGRTPARAAALHTAAALANLQSDYAAARSHVQESLAISEERADRAGIARALLFLSYLTSDGEEAWQLATRGVALFREGNDPAGVASALTAFALLGLGDVARLEGDGAGALTRYAESLRTVQAAMRPECRITDHDHRNADVCAAFLRSIAAALRRSGHDEPALRLLGAAGALAEAMGLILSAATQADYGEQISALRFALGEDAFVAALAEGRAMTPERAVQYALDAICSG
jgi:non-specific serine/threonine protein kinase